MLIVSSLNLFSSVTEAFGQCIYLHLVAGHSLVLGEKGGETASLPLCFSILCSAWKTLLSSCELRPSDLRCKDSSAPGVRSSSDEEQALASTSNYLYLEWPDVPLV